MSPVASPFPGMDPYLENHWADVHASLVTYARDQLQTQLPEQLLARTEERILVQYDDGTSRSFYPDVGVVERTPEEASGASPAGTTVADPIVLYLDSEPITETYVEILEAGSDNRVITVIEFLSITNKTPGDGQDQYIAKQRELIVGQVNLVEIDLLRAGKRIQACAESGIPKKYRTLYRACVRRAAQPRKAEFYPISLRERLPTIRIPLRENDQDVLLNLQDLIDQAYRNGRYHLTDYKAAPEPNLPVEDAAWVDELLRAAKKR